ncbi:MAG: AbrB/MazE/SpoVT family DNA-binding domain-containing protein [Archaeoglobales archaeon]|nr:MAG: AbrB/MazE/SpoVT family DNA-binding domain-containing protein [Archaeoglobales archaeon]
MIYGVDKRKVDEQGRIILPSDWRERELKDCREVFVIRYGKFLKIIPKRKIDLTEFFDGVDLGVNVEDWRKFEREFYEVSRC